MSGAKANAAKSPSGLLRLEIFSDEGGLDWLRPAKAVARPKLAWILLGNFFATGALIVATATIQNEQVVWFTANILDEPTACATELGCGRRIVIDVTKYPALRLLRPGDRVEFSTSSTSTLRTVITMIDPADTVSSRLMVGVDTREPIPLGPVRVSATMHRTLLSLIAGRER